MASHALLRYQASECEPLDERCIVIESPEYLFEEGQFFCKSKARTAQLLESQRAVCPRTTALPAPFRPSPQMPRC